MFGGVSNFRSAMFPFFPSIPNHIRAQGVNDLASDQQNSRNFPASPFTQQNTSAISDPNQMSLQTHNLSNQFQPQLMPVFNYQNGNLNNMIGNCSAMPNRPQFVPPNCYPNGVNQFTMQNVLMGVQSLLQSCAQINYPMNLNPMAMMSMQGNIHNAPPNLSQFPQQQIQGQFNVNGIWPANFPQNVNQPTGLLQGNFPSQNPTLTVKNAMPPQCVQNALGSVQSFPFNSNPVVSQSSSANAMQGNLENHGPPTMSMGWNSRKESMGISVASSQIPGISTASPPGLQQNGKNFQSRNYPNESFSRTPHGHWKGGQSQSRFQKSRSPNVGKKNFKPFNENGGPAKGRKRNPQFSKSNQQFDGLPRRPRTLIYSEREIHQWREARKRNFPTTARTEKMFAGTVDSNEAMNIDAKIRRQQLKDVLAKQAELGIEVAELPPNYFSDPESQTAEADDGRSHNTSGRFQNKYNKRARRSRDNRNSKRQKPWKDAGRTAVPVQRKPTLLQKLLSADVKRDKSKLLQVFRFMTLNSFFDQLPAKPLAFPQITAKDTVFSGDGKSGGLDDANIISETKSVIEEIQDRPEIFDIQDKSSDGDSSSICPSDDHQGDEEEAISEQLEKSEEGEISD